MENGLEWTSEGTDVTTRGGIIRWWEARRFSLTLLSKLSASHFGFSSCLLVLPALSRAYFEEPLAMLFGPFIYAVLASEHV